MKRQLLAVAAAAWSCVVVFSLGAETEDARVRAALETSGLKFEVNGRHNYTARFDMPDGRFQRVFVNSGTTTSGNYEFREVWSVAYVGVALSGETLENLLDENADLKLGGWRLVSGEQTILLFSVPVPANADGRFLASAMMLCASSSDQMEKSLADSDSF